MIFVEIPLHVLERELELLQEVNPAPGNTGEFLKGAIAAIEWAAGRESPPSRLFPKIEVVE